jgi:thiamine biosynthesis lipoprotein
MGEIRAIGGRPLGGPWIVGLEDPAVPGMAGRRIALENKAVSTSGGYGTPISPDGRFNHIFDPATGGTSWRYRAVSVVAETSTTADALSTAFCLLPEHEILRVAKALRTGVYIVRRDGAWEVT